MPIHHQILTINYVFVAWLAPGGDSRPRQSGMVRQKCDFVTIFVFDFAEKQGKMSRKKLDC